MSSEQTTRHEVALVDDALILKNRSASKATETKRALNKNWFAFAQWCDLAGRNALPASVDTVERYLLYLAEHHPIVNRRGDTIRIGMKPSAIAQALWAINQRHQYAAAPSPGTSMIVKTALAGIRRRKGTRTKQQRPLSIEQISQLQFRSDLKGKRDKALLLIGFAGCLRRSELVGIRVEDIESAPYGLEIVISRGKTDQDGRGQSVTVMRSVRSPEVCPVRALEDWLDAADIASGNVFRSLTKGARPTLGRNLSAASVDSIVKWAAGALGLDPRHYGGHSLRAGHATYLSEKGKSPVVIARHGRWKSLNMVLTYCRGETARELEGLY